jgi:hypothetical protein
LQDFNSLFSGELFPTEVRAFCKSLTRTFACVLLVICLKTFPVLEEQLQFFGTFYLFAVVLLVAMPIVYLLLPETKDVALEDVQHFFNREQSIFFIKLPPRTDKNDPAKPEYDFSVRL